MVEAMSLSVLVMTLSRDRPTCTIPAANRHVFMDFLLGVGKTAEQGFNHAWQQAGCAETNKAGLAAGGIKLKSHACALDKLSRISQEGKIRQQRKPQEQMKPAAIHRRLLLRHLPRRKETEEERRTQTRPAPLQ